MITFVNLPSTADPLSVLPRVCVVTAGHLSTCPRMVKAADALFEAGYAVRVVSANFVSWAGEFDQDVRRTRDWPWVVVNYERQSAISTYLASGFRYRACRLVSQLFQIDGPLHLVNCAYSRIHSELVRAVVAEPADLIYAGTGMALGAGAEAATRLGVPYALDLEDFHSAEQLSSRDANVSHRLVERIERTILPNAIFVTAASHAISAAYLRKYGIRAITVNNVCSLPSNPADIEVSPYEALRLYWFSQTIGPGRGLEDAIKAVGLAGITAELHVRGRPVPGYLTQMRDLASKHLARLKIIHHRPLPSDSMINSCRGHDIGLALEQEDIFNRAICLTNKAFTYILGGLAVIFTDTPGQHDLAIDLGEGALIYRPGNVEAFAVGLKRWAEDKSQLTRAKRAALEAGYRRWHWEHPLEKGALLDAVAQALNSKHASRDYC
jgi:glycosyltransferase involved in cell wall biosynthesis